MRVFTAEDLPEIVDYSGPMEATLDVIGGKWEAVINGTAKETA